MSSAAVSSNSLFQQLQSFYQQRSSDLQQLGQALESGDTTTAQTEYNDLVTLGQSGPFSSGDPFRNSTREQDFANIGQDLQSGDLTDAQSAFAALASTFGSRFANSSSNASSSSSSASSASSTNAPEIVIDINTSAAASSSSTATTSTSSSSAATSASNSNPEVVINIGSGSAGAQSGPVTIDLTNNGSGGEQLTISVAGQQNQSPQQVTLNLQQNEEILLNLFGANSASQSQSSAVNVQA